MRMNKRRLRRTVYGLLAVVLLAIAGFVGWAETPLGPDNSAVAALVTTDKVVVEHNDWIVFQPTQNAPTTGLIFYPGGRVDPRSYAPLAQAIAARGYLFVIVPMPLNLAVLAPNRANDVLAAFPNVEYWAVGGHSLGGAMACIFTAEHPNAVQGMILMGAYCAGANVSQLPLEVTSITGTKDGVLNREQFAAGCTLLPPSRSTSRLRAATTRSSAAMAHSPATIPLPSAPQCNKNKL